MSFTFEADNPYAVRVGDIVTSDGKRHKVTKVTRTAIAASRYYWFDELFDKLKGKLAKDTNVQP